jgi:apoptosis-inducing factor 3
LIIIGGGAAALRDSDLALSDGTILDADFIVVGVRVRPLLALANHAGLTLDRGVVANQYLETSHVVAAVGWVTRKEIPVTYLRKRMCATWTKNRLLGQSGRCQLTSLRLS